MSTLMDLKADVEWNKKRFLRNIDSIQKKINKTFPG